MRHFLDENFLLHNRTSQYLYHEYAKKMSIIDYHCHLPPQEIAEDKQFENITQIWLAGDHYKWRALRANGVDESYCTGNKSDWQKFEQWAATVPFTLRNPLFHWTHLELQRYFDIHQILGPGTAREIYEACNEALRTPAFSVRNLLRKMNVRLVCTTDDPLDDLRYHRQLKKEEYEVVVFPAFRPDAAIKVEDASGFKKYLQLLGESANDEIHSFSSYVDALKKRHDYFARNGCSVADHGLEEMYSEDASEKDIERIFNKVIKGDDLERTEVIRFKSMMLQLMAQWNHEKGWVQQYHLGAIRDNNSRMTKKIGSNTGWDSIGDFPQARALSSFLDKLDRENRLAKTILYNVNPSDNEVMATMIGNFNDGSSTGKIQWGSAWWFMDQKDGMIRQINTLSNMGLLSRFVGMLTDSRSFLSYPRHEYFRRILCNLFG
ncbi:MAG TPA: glucuronate isomerase, partial [Puia sp.]|nr:glucuronate isomerase [Puia sp.]